MLGVYLVIEPVANDVMELLVVFFDLGPPGALISRARFDQQVEPPVVVIKGNILKSARAALAMPGRLRAALGESGLYLSNMWEVVEDNRLYRK